MLRRTLLVCGILSSLLYLGIDTLAAWRYPDYHSYLSQAISELGAVGAPTRTLVDPLFLIYTIMIVAFGVGVCASAQERRALRVIGSLLIGIGAIGLVTPPMNLRGTAGVTGDLPHIVLTGVIVLFILSAIVCGAALYGRRWRLYSWATVVTLVVSGAGTGFEAGRLAAHQPTPWLGLAERINIGAYLLWTAVLAVSLLRVEESSSPLGLGRHQRSWLTA
ncbi:MAG TPA: DUF998 domain-containing protein [Myxococcota bacterium]|jgi:hypothetical membrane protein|nr:DUF998 domain-containing protein [Myxococcota bacterium]